MSWRGWAAAGGLVSISDDWVVVVVVVGGGWRGGYNPKDDEMTLIN